MPAGYCLQAWGCGKRPRNRRAAEQRDEAAPLHLITLLAHMEVEAIFVLRRPGTK
jgi:hypothetical protein